MSNSFQVTNQKNLERKANLPSLLCDPQTGIQSSEERVSAKKRLSIQTEKRIRAGLGDSNSDSKNFQEINVQYLEDTFQPSILNNITQSSSLNIFVFGRLGPCERSPIRTLSEDRVHVSLPVGLLHNF
ncbi:hypothetical protein IGI04_021438 [Brassica rapa subsp. trilocularis]|uniref:Uncharacterized protein n=2 Tax=Brassica campestris TaxID=3711 RepID=A0ABQ7LZH7_BRACM|nr:hypothetical protein IGI04_021438 [Brassica rapa subsp. trilocularis]